MTAAGSTAKILVACEHCGAQNRVPLFKLATGSKPVCGKCKRPLELRPIAVSDATFAVEVERAPLPVLVDAWAAWCGPCRAVAPIVDELARELAGRVLVAKLDVDANPLTAQRFGLRSIPTLLIFKNGHEVGRIVGAQPKHAITQQLERSLG